MSEIHYKLNRSRISIVGIGTVESENFTQEHAKAMIALDKQYNTKNVAKYLIPCLPEDVENDDQAELEEVRLNYQTLTGLKPGNKKIATLLSAINEIQESEEVEE